MENDAKKLKNLLEKNLDNVINDRETGIMLSGGLDSSVAACILLNKGETLRSISSSFREFSMYDETKYIEMIKNRYPRLETNYITPIDITLLSELKELIGIIKKPIASGSPILQYLIMKKARKLNMKKMIYCQWPDELMGGYSSFLLDKAHDDFRHLKIFNAIVNIIEYIQRTKMVKTDLILLRTIKGLITSKGLKIALSKSIPNIEHLIDIAQKTAKALGISLILPYADPEIAGFCQLLNPDRLVYRGQTKIILREAAANIVPEEILIRRKKFGFYAPDSIWLLKNKKDIENLKNKALKKEYKKFLKNPQKRWYRKLWLTLSSIYLKNGE